MFKRIFSIFAALMFFIALFPTAYADTDLSMDFSFGYDGMIVTLRYHWAGTEGEGYEVLTELPESYEVYSWDVNHEYGQYLKVEKATRIEIQTTYAIPDLGDSSVSAFALAALAALAIMGAVIAHRQASHKANHESEGSADLSAPASLQDG